MTDFMFKSFRFLVQTVFIGALCHSKPMAPSKRKSGGQASEKAKSAKTSSGRADADKVAATPHIAKMTDWFLGVMLIISLVKLGLLHRLEKEVMPKGGPSAYFAAKYPDKDREPCTFHFSLQLF